MRRLLKNLTVLLILLAIVLVNVVPLVWGLLTSLKGEAELFSYPPVLFDFTPTLEHYATVWANEFGVALRNSLAYSLVSVAFGLALGSTAAYGFDRFRFRLRAPLFFLLIASIPLAIGAASLLVPNYLFFTFIGVTNTWFTLPLIYVAYMLPMTVWILKGAMAGIPREIDEAAHIDGASTWVVFSQIVLPLTRPALGAAGLFLFMHAWNEFIAGSVMVDSPSLKPVQVVIYQFIDFFGRDWGPLTASATLAIVPIVFVYLFFGRLLIAGLTHGAVKH